MVRTEAVIRDFMAVALGGLAVHEARARVVILIERMISVTIAQLLVQFILSANFLIT